MAGKQRPAFHTSFFEPVRGDWAATAALLIGAAIALYVATSRWPDTPDGLFHLQRVRGLSAAISAGVLYPRWFPDFAFEYGHPIFNYYAPAFYHPPALLHLAGVGIITATRLTLALLFGLSGVAMYWLLRLWTGIPAALAGALVYLLFPYRLYDLFIRGALPEFAAFTWLPLLILAAVLAAHSLGSVEERASERRWQAAIVILASLAWAGLILTHNLTALMAAMSVGAVLILMGIGAYFSRNTEQAQSAGSRRSPGPIFAIILGMTPIVVGTLLAAWYVLPALWESSWVSIGADPASSGYLNHFAVWQDLFSWSARYAYPSAAEATVPLPGWLLLLLIAGLLALPLASKQRLTVPLAIGLTLTVGAIWLTTASSAFLWSAAAPLMGKLQFPWRWQSIVALGAAMLAAVIVQFTARAIRRWTEPQQGDGVGEDRPTPTWADGWPAWLIAAAIIGIVAINALGGLTYAGAPYTDGDITRQQMWAFDAEYGQIGMTWTGEFLPRWVQEQRWAIGQAPSDGSTTAGMAATAMSATPRQIDYLGGEYAVDAVEPSTLSWHRFYFPAWQVTLDGQPVETFPLGDLGLLSIAVPAGNHEVTLRWTATSAVQAGRWLALLAWLLILTLLVAAGFRRRWPVGWLVLGGVAVVLMLVPPANRSTPTMVGADFGTVRLEAASASTARPGELGRVRLHWLISEPSPPLTAFVHVLDGSGAVVAQNDAPLAGAYTPPERWTPGLLIDYTHEIEMPATLPPGVYTLMAGLYEPGHADTPITPAGQDQPRVDIGQMELRP